MTIPDSYSIRPDVHGDKETSDTFKRLMSKVIGASGALAGDGTLVGRLLSLEGSAASTAPANAEYLVGTANGTLTAERVVTDTTSITWDLGTAAQAKAKRTALTGDITASADSNATTLASIISAGGPTGSATVAPIITYDAKGRLTAVSSATVTPAVGSITGLGSGVATFLATPTSANLASAVTNETGSGLLVFNDTPTLVTPVLGAATGTSLQLSGLTASEILGTDGSKNLVSLAVATYPSLTELTYVKGVTSAIQTQLNAKQALDATLTSLAAVAGVQGDLLYASGTDTWARLAKNASASRYLSNTGSSNDPAWAQVDLTNGVTGLLPQANIAKTGTVIARIIKVKPPASSGAQETSLAGGSTPAEDFNVWAFDQTGPEYLDFYCRLSPQYLGGGLTIVHQWSGNATTNNVRWGGAIRRFADNSEQLSASQTYDYNDATDTAAPSSTTIGRSTNITFTSGSDMDSLAAGEFFIYRVRRTAATSNMAADAYLWDVEIRET